MHRITIDCQTCDRETEIEDGDDPRCPGCIAEEQLRNQTALALCAAIAELVGGNEAERRAGLTIMAAFGSVTELYALQDEVRTTEQAARLEADWLRELAERHPVEALELQARAVERLRASKPALRVVPVTAEVRATFRERDEAIALAEAQGALPEGGR